MIRRVLAAFLICLGIVCVARGADVALSPVTEGPSRPHVIGIVPRAGGFLLVTQTWTGHRSRIWGTRISNQGELDAHPVLLASHDFPAFSNTYRLIHENGVATLEIAEAIEKPSASANRYDYEIQRLTIDADAARVVATEQIKQDERLPYLPKNAKGESLTIPVDNGAVVNSILFVGTDGVPRKPTALPEVDSVMGLTVVPVGDEWILVGRRELGVVWYRISEARRDMPAKLILDEFSAKTFRSSIAHAGADFAVAYDDITSPSPGRYNRSLTLRTIDANGMTARYTLFSETNVPLRAAPSTVEPSIARDGNAWVVAYPYYNGSDTSELRTWRVSPAGVEGTTPLVSIGGAGRLITEPLVASGARRTTRCCSFVR